MRTFDQALSTNTLRELAIAAGVATMAFVVGILARRFIRAKFERMCATPEHELLEIPLRVVSKTTSLFLGIVAMFIGVSTLDLPERIHVGVFAALAIASFVQVGLWCSTAVVAWLERKQSSSADRAAVGTFGLIGFVARALIWILVSLLVLDNLGVNITALIAGLGIGGIAVALAVQNVLSDLLASLSIALDKPFLIGDFVVVDDFMGSVENIGIKSVRIRSLSGEQVVMSNADLLGSRVRNYGRLIERRVVFTIGVTYETPRATLERIPQLLRAIIEAQEDTRFDRAHFAKHGDCSLDFESVFYVLSADYNRYMDIQQAINFAIHAAFEREHIEFAYPTRKLWIANAEPASVTPVRA